MTTWKTNTMLQMGVRPDALSDLCADICVAGGMSAPPITVSSVEHRDHNIASFFVSIEVPTHLRTEILAIVDKYCKDR